MNGFIMALAIVCVLYALFLSSSYLKYRERNKVDSHLTEQKINNTIGKFNYFKLRHPKMISFFDNMDTIYIDYAKFYIIVCVLFSAISILLSNIDAEIVKDDLREIYMHLDNIFGMILVMDFLLIRLISPNTIDKELFSSLQYNKVYFIAWASFLVSNLCFFRNEIIWALFWLTMTIFSIIYIIFISFLASKISSLYIYLKVRNLHFLYTNNISNKELYEIREKILKNKKILLTAIEKYYSSCFSKLITYKIEERLINGEYCYVKNYDSININHWKKMGISIIIGLISTVSLICLCPFLNVQYDKTINYYIILFFIIISIITYYFFNVWLYTWYGRRSIFLIYNGKKSILTDKFINCFNNYKYLNRIYKATYILHMVFESTEKNEKVEEKYFDSDKADLSQTIYDVCNRYANNNELYFISKYILYLYNFLNEENLETEYSGVDVTSLNNFFEMYYSNKNNDTKF